MSKISLWLTLFGLDIAFSQSFTFRRYDTFAFNTSDVTWTDDNAILGEISGLTHNNDNVNPIFYGISDTILAPYQKTLWEFDYTNTNAPPIVTGITLEDPPNQLLNVSDTENVIYIESDNTEKYFIIGTEGYRQWNTNTSFWVYNEDNYTGYYISELPYPDLFREVGMDETDLVSGFNEGDGFESASITSDYTTIVLIGSNSLVQDECADEGCVRILITAVDKTNAPTWTAGRQYRYDKDSSRGGVTVTDATIIENDLSRVIVLEKTEFNDGSYRVVAYQIDLSETTLGATYDVSSCQALNDQCAQNMAIPKQMVNNLFDFNSDITGIDMIDFDAIAIGLGSGCQANEKFMVAASDNDEIWDTYLLQLCLTVQPPTPAPTIPMVMSPPEIGFPTRVLGYDTIAQNFMIDSTPFWEISGLSQDNGDSNDPVTFYAVSDTILQDFDKMIFTFQLTENGGDIQVTNINGTVMDQPHNVSGTLKYADTETIIYVGNGVVVGTEGYREFGTDINFWFYYTVDGYHESFLSMTLNSVFDQQGTGANPTNGFPEDDGFEAMAISSNYNEGKVVLIGSNTLVQDDCAMDGCVRISVNDFDPFGGGSFLKETYQYRYDKDVFENGNNRVVDVTVVEDDLSFVIVMEESESVVNDVYTFDARLYMIDISDNTLGTGYDIKDCAAFDGSTCSNENMVVSKTLIFDFKTIPDSVIPNVETIDFDAITYGNVVGSVRGDCSADGYFLVAASDNDETQDTYFVFLCYEPSKISLIDYSTLPFNATSVVGENTTISEISGLSHNNDPYRPRFYGVSDTILKDYQKQIFSFNLKDLEEVPGVPLAEPPYQELKFADTENVVYFERDDGEPFFIVATEGYREFDTNTNFFLFACDGSFAGNLSYNTAVFQEVGVDETDLVSGFGEGDGIEAMSVTSDYSTLIFFGSHTLVQDDCGMEGCVRISVNTLNVGNSSTMPTMSEDYQVRYDMDAIPSGYMMTKNTVADATIINDLNKVIVMEKAETILDDNSSYFDVRIYEIDLSMGVSYDISSCQSLTSGSCANYDMVIPKKLVGDFKTMNIPDVTMIDFDAIAYGYGDGCDTGYFLLAASDNDEVMDTYLVSLCYAGDWEIGGMDNEPGISNNEVSVLGYDIIPPTEMIDGTYVWEISGLSHNNHEAISRYYGVSDTILQDFTKQIFAFLLEKGVPKPALDEIAGIPLEEPPYQALKFADTENIVYLEDGGGGKYFIIGTEGYRQYDTFTNLFLYDCEGTFIGNLSYNTDIFKEQGIFACPTYGFDEGDGIEAMSVSSDYATLVFIGSNTLVQDDCGYDGCVRISVNSMDYSGDIPTMTEDYQFRYTKDYVGESNRVVDVTVVEDDLSVVIIMEEARILKDGIIEGQSPSDYNFSIRLYAVNLANVILNNADYDIKDCRRLTSLQCINYDVAINKTLISDFASDFGWKSIDFDAIAYGDGPGCPTGYFLVAASDNDETENTTLAYLCYDVGMTPPSDNNNPTVDKKISVLGYDKFGPNTAITTGDATTPVSEISGLSHNNRNDEDGVFYGVSDIILQSFPKQIFIFDIEGDIIPSLLKNDIKGIVLTYPPNQPASTADTETIAYLENSNSDKFFVIGTEGYRQYNKFTNFFIFDDGGDFIGNLSYNTDIFQEQGTLACPTYGYDEGDGIESMSATSDYGKLVFAGSNTLVQDECYMEGCIRISVNSMDYTDLLTGPIMTELYQIRYDKDIYVSPNTINTVVDITILEDDLSKVLVLEKAETIDELGVSTFDQRVYEIDIPSANSYDIKDCIVLNDDCTHYARKVSKTLVGDFTDFAAGNENLAEVTTIDFDSLAVGHGIGCDNGYFLLASSDNGEIFDTYFIYLCYDAGFTKQPTTTPTQSGGPTTAPSEETEGAMQISFKIAIIASILIAFFVN